MILTTVLLALAAPDRAYHFENDVIPLLSRHGCNSSGCHQQPGGSQSGIYK